MNCDDQEICTHRAPGVCCPEPSCDHGWHGRLKKMMPHEKNKLVCEGCGKACNQCEWLIAEVERLRSLNESLMENGNDLRTRCQKAEARIKELQDLIDKPPEEADWVADYHLLQSALDGPIIDAARKWHAAYRKAQNSNLMRAKEVERLRSHHIQIMGKIRAWILNDCAEVCRGFDWRDEEISRQREEIDAKDARIEELEEMIRQLGSLAFMGDMPLDQIVAHFIAWGQSNYDYTSRLEAAFLDSLAARLYYEHYPGVSDAYSWHDCPEDACHCMPKEKFREKAREALERIKAETGSGDHVAGANKLILTAEQREALEHVIEYVQETQMPISNLNEFDMQELRSLLTGSKPAWEVTEERIAAMKDACNFLVYAEIRNKGVNPGSVDRAKNAGDVLRAMLAGGKRDA